MSNMVFVTGGVLSSLGKGIIASSIARLLKDNGLKINMMKLDPYLNVDQEQCHQSNMVRFL